jgi:hypothetical protein
MKEMHSWLKTLKILGYGAQSALRPYLFRKRSHRDWTLGLVTGTSGMGGMALMLSFGHIGALGEVVRLHSAFPAPQLSLRQVLVQVHCQYYSQRRSQLVSYSKLSVSLLQGWMTPFKYLSDEGRGPQVFDIAATIASENYLVLKSLNAKFSARLDLRLWDIGPHHHCCFP